MARIRDRYTGKYAPGEWVHLDVADVDLDIPCAECGAEGDQMCSFEDPDRPGFGVEVGSYVHAIREVQVREAPVSEVQESQT